MCRPKEYGLWASWKTRTGLWTGKKKSPFLKIVQSSPVQCRVQARFSNWPWFVCLFGQKTGINFAHFGLESGMDFEGTMGVYVSIPNEGENLKGFLRKLFVCVLT